MTMQRSTRLEFETLEDRVTPATLTWLGAVDGLWSHAGNWSTTDPTHPTPHIGDTVVLPQGAAHKIQTNDLVSSGQITQSNTVALSSITFQDVGYQILGDPIDGNIDCTASPAGMDEIDCNIHFFQVQETVALASNFELVLGGNVTVDGPISEASTTVHVTGPASSVLAVRGAISVVGQAAHLDVASSVQIFGTLSVPGTPGVTIEPAGSVYVAGLVTVDGNLTLSGGLLLVESGGELFAHGSVQDLGGEIYTAGVIIVEDAGLLYLQGGQSFLVVAGGGVLYSAGLTEATQGSQLFIFGTAQVAAPPAPTNQTLGIYVYDSVVTVESGGALYAYGTVAIEVDSALYDYGVLALEPSGYLYNADLVVIEPGGVFYDYGTFANFGTYYNFGHQIGG